MPPEKERKIRDTFISSSQLTHRLFSGGKELSPGFADHSCATSPNELIKKIFERSLAEDKRKPLDGPTKRVFDDWADWFDSNWGSIQKGEHRLSPAESESSDPVSKMKAKSLTLAAQERSFGTFYSSTYHLAHVPLEFQKDALGSVAEGMHFGTHESLGLTECEHEEHKQTRRMLHELMEHSFFGFSEEDKRKYIDEHGHTSHQPTHQKAVMFELNDMNDIRNKMRQNGDFKLIREHWKPFRDEAFQEKVRQEMGGNPTKDELMDELGRRRHLDNTIKPNIHYVSLALVKADPKTKMEAYHIVDELQAAEAVEKGAIRKRVAKMLGFEGREDEMDEHINELKKLSKSW